MAREDIRQAKARTTDQSQADAASLHFLRKLLDGAAVQRNGKVVTVHAAAASGLDALLAVYAKELAQDKK